MILDLMPGLEVSVVFQDTDGLIVRLFSWAEKGPEPLQSYAIGLLASAMELQDLAANFREQNAHLAPILLKRLWEIQTKSMEERKKNPVPRRLPPASSSTGEPARSEQEPVRGKGANGKTPRSVKESDDHDLMPEPAVEELHDRAGKGKAVRKKLHAKRASGSGKFSSKQDTSLNGSLQNDSSNSSWAEMESYVIGNFFIIISSTLAETLKRDY